ncbi:RadC family protein [Ligilactobacillus equi]
MTLINAYRQDDVVTKLTKWGSDSLSQKEILHFLLETMMPKRVAAKVVANYFENYSHIAQLRNFTPAMWRGLIDDDRYWPVLAILQAFAQSYQKRPKVSLGEVCSSREVGKYMSERYGFEKQEHLVGLYLDTKNQVIAEKVIFIGTLNSATVHPREIFREALAHSAAHVLIVHNHPSGKVTPSKNDLHLTKRLVDCGELLGIDLLDHIIVGDSDYLSLREEGIIKS